LLSGSGCARTSKKARVALSALGIDAAPLLHDRVHPAVLTNRTFSGTKSPATVVFLVQHPGDALVKARVELALVRRPARRTPFGARVHHVRFGHVLHMRQTRCLGWACCLLGVRERVKWR